MDYTEEELNEYATFLTNHPSAWREVIGFYDTDPALYLKEKQDGREVSCSINGVFTIDQTTGEKRDLSEPQDLFAYFSEVIDTRDFLAWTKRGGRLHNAMWGIFRAMQKCA